MKIGILGDFCLSFVDSTINFSKIVEDFSKSNILNELNNNTINIINLEAPITNSNKMIEKTGPSLKNPEETIDIIKLMNVQICTLANNHIFDFGVEGLKDTLNICEKNNLKTVGAGLDLQQIYKPLIVEDNEVKVAIIAFAENEFNTIHLQEQGAGSNNLDIIEICSQIHNAKSKSDYVVLIAHGGHEEYHYPSPRIKKLYRFFIDSGADALIGHHPHVVQGFEEYKGKPIFYSIGNYFFPSSDNNKSNNEGFVVVLNILKDSLDYSFLPYTQSINNFQVNLMGEEQKIEFMKSVESFSSIILNDSMLKKNWLDFVQSRKEVFFNSLFPLNPKIASRLIKYGLDKFFVPQKHFIKLLNLIRCESHRDILINSLKEKYYDNK